jgi:hypothetical protein
VTAGATGDDWLSPAARWTGSWRRWPPLCGARRRGASAARWLALALALSACRRKHVPVDVVPDLGYPACLEGGLESAGVLVGQGHIRSGPISNDKSVSERFEFRRTPCGATFRTRQEWPLAISDVEVRYDRQLRPIWAWKRMTIAGSRRPDGNADIRRYELREGGVFITRRDDHGQSRFEKLLPGGRVAVPAGMHVGAVVAPGRGMLTPWLQRAKLAIGATQRELVLDFREAVETLELATLERNDDRFEASIGRNVRVYTFYGRETVFADDEDVVIGDLAGMRPSDSLSTPEPAALPTYGGPDPVHTP